MEPNSVSERVITEQVAETQMGPAPMEPVALPEKKKSNSMLIGLILCLLLAIGGISFGIWAILDGNSRVDSLNKQIENLQDEKSDLLLQIDELNKKISLASDVDAVVEDGIFYIVDGNGKVLMQSDGEVEVTDIVDCKWYSDDTIAECAVDTSEGEGWFLYDAFGDSLQSSFDEEQE